MSSGFNLGQSGNATEAGAGVVKLATQAQIDNGDASDGGVPLVVTPDKIASGVAFDQFLAAENLTAGDAVTVGPRAIATGVVSYSQTNEDGTIPGTFALTNLQGQVAISFVASSVAKSLKKISLKLRPGAADGAFTISIKQNIFPVSATLYSYGTGSLGATTSTVLHEEDNIDLPLTPGATYYITIAQTNFPGGGAENRRGVAVSASVTSPLYYQSTDTGATYDAGTATAPYLIIEEDQYGARPVSKTDATDLEKTGLAGFATATVLSGNPVNVDGSKLNRKSSQTFVEGAEYYVGDTPGILSPGPETNPRPPVGIAVDTDKLLLYQRRQIKTGINGAGRVELGFRPTIIRATGGGSGGGEGDEQSTGIWVEGVYACLWGNNNNGTNQVRTDAIIYRFNNGVTITDVDDTGFTFTGGSGLVWMWEAQSA